MATREIEVDEILDRGTIVEIFPSREEFRGRLLNGERLRFYIGFDATAPTLHLSHAKNIMLLEKFRKLGHEVILLFGDFTARIGDPTGEISARKQLTKEEVERNVVEWQRQIRPLMKFDDPDNPPKIRFNSEWLAKLSFEEVLYLASNVTVQRMLERDMFEKRIKAGEPIHLHEFLYPLMQGYDSVAMEVDAELCGTDQTFNALVGRTLLKKFKQKEKFVVAVTLMENPKTGDLMSKSKGTGVFLNTSAREMFGQIMAQPDEMMELLFVNCTFLSLKEIGMLLKSDNPRDAKLRLAKELVSIFHSSAVAEKEEQYFIETFSKRNVIVEDVVEKSILAGSTILEALVAIGFAQSKSDARRKIEQGGVSLDGEKITDQAFILDEKYNGKILRVGKKNIAKIVF